MTDTETDRMVRDAYGDDSQRALALLGTYGVEGSHREVDRVRRAILKLSGGDLTRLEQYVAQARRDYRDVLYWAEYPRDPCEPKSYEELREHLRMPPEGDM